MNVFRQRGIKFKLIVSVLASCTVVFGIIFAYDYLVFRRIIESKIEATARNLAEATAQKIEAVLRSIEKVPGELAGVMEKAPPDKRHLLDVLQASIERNPEIFGGTVAFEPFAFDGKSRYFAPYYFRENDRIRLKYLGDDSYQFHSWEWYAAPKQSQKSIWTEPYYDEGGGEVIMSTFSVPFYQDRDGRRAFTGIVTADVSLTWLQDLLASIKIGKTGYGFLISKQGKFVTHPRADLILKATVFSAAEQVGDKSLLAIGKEMVAGKRGFALTRSLVTGKPCWMAYVPLKSTGWSLAVLFPQDELMADVHRLNHVVLAIGLGGFVFLAIMIILISGSITRPLCLLARATQDIARGNLDFEPPANPSGDEVGRLAESFTCMQASLKRYIRELTETTTARQKIDSELRIAHDIQMSMLPKVFPPFPNRPEFDVYAVLEPAKEVGGDLYDFFFTDDTHLCFVIGDVSGKGVPASLLMAVTKTLIKTTAQQTQEPAEILARVNRELCHENDSCMFVTVFIAILDTRTGEVRFSNGGHNPPLLVGKHGQLEFLRGAKGLAIGVMEEARFGQDLLRLGPGETLVLYTDGVTEAADAQEKLFSEERLQTCVAAHAGEPVEQLVENVLKEVHAFSRDVPQSDDISIMALRFQDKMAGENSTPDDAMPAAATLQLKNDLGEIARLSAWVKGRAREYALSDRLTYNLTLVLDELVTNVISYAYEDTGEHLITVRLSHEPGAIRLEVEDDGKPFDPLQAAQPDTSLPVEQRPIGGLGIHFVRKTMDDLHYRRENNHNILSMMKRLESTTGI